MRPFALLTAIAVAHLPAAARAQSDLAAVKKEEGDTRLRDGDSAAALAAYERAMDIDAGYLPAYDAAAPLWFSAGDWATAIRRLKIAVWNKPKYAMGWYNLGFAYRKSGEHAQAVEAYRAFIALRPKEPDPYFGLGMTYKAMGDTARAREAFSRYVKLERRPEKQKFVKQARGELDALAGTITPIAGGGAETADSENERGARLFQDKKTDDAIPAFERAVQLDPKHKVAWYNLAHARRKAGRHAEAVQAYRAFIALDPENPDPYYGLGHSLRATGDQVGARAAFERYVALEKRDSEKKFVAKARETLGEIEREGAGEPASQPASQPVVAQPAAPARPEPSLTASPAEIEARYRKGVALEKKGDRAGAIKAWELTLLFSPEHPRARRSIEVAREREGRQPPPDRAQVLERARALTADGRAATAIALLGPAFATAGAQGDVDLLAVRAQARLGSGDTPGAISDWNLVLSLDPRRADAWLGLGDAYAAAGDKPRARWFYEGFLARAGSDPTAGEVRKRLEAP